MNLVWRIRAGTAVDHEWIERFMVDHWGDRSMVMCGEILCPAEFPAFICEAEGIPIGLVTYRIVGEVCEVLSLDSLHEGEGIGSALMQAVIKKARKAHCRRMRLITTNDNLRALGFYQKRGFYLNAVFPDAVRRSRELKPSIPLIGANGIPIRDEIELTLQL